MLKVFAIPSIISFIAVSMLMNAINVNSVLIFCILFFALDFVLIGIVSWFSIFMDWGEDYGAERRHLEDQLMQSHHLDELKEIKSKGMGQFNIDARSVHLYNNGRSTVDNHSEITGHKED